MKPIIIIQNGKACIHRGVLLKKSNRYFLKRLGATFFHLIKVSNIKISLNTKEKPISFLFPAYVQDDFDKCVFRESEKKDSYLQINENEPGLENNEEKAPRSYLVYPLFGGKKRIGQITFRDKLDSRYFTLNDRKIVQVAAKVTGDFMSNLYYTDDSQLVMDLAAILPVIQRFFSSQKELVDYDTMVSEIIKLSRMINASIDIHHLLGSIMESSKMVLKTEGSSLMLLDEKKENLIFSVVSGEKDEALKKMTIPIGKGIAGEVALNRKAEIVNDVQSDSRHFKNVDEASHYVTRNLIATPLMVKNEMIGVLEAINTVGRMNFKKKDLQRFITFSEQAALAIHNRDLIESLKVSNRNLQKRISELSGLHKFSQQITRTFSVDNILQSYLDLLIEQFDPFTISILLYDEKKDKLIIRYAFGLPAEALHSEIQLDNNLSGEVFKSRKSFFTNDLRSTKYSRFFDANRYNNGNCIIYYLSLGDKPFGIVNLSKKDSVHSYQKSNLRLLITLSTQLSQAISNYSMVNEMLEKKAYEKELQITSHIQRAILPRTKVDNPLLDLAHYYQPAKTMGGDFYDFNINPEGTSHFSIADVSGKSLPAALFMALASSIVRTVFQTEKLPSLILKMANELIYQNSEGGMFVTMFLTSYDAPAKTLSYSSAGHNRQILLKNGSNEPVYLSAKGKPLGILPSSEGHVYEEKSIGMESGDILVLYTDGVVESINPQNEEYGMDRFLDILYQNRDVSVATITEKVYADVLEFCGTEPQFDDFTLMIIRIK